MGIVGGLISPHPAIIVPEVGGKEVQKVADTVSALGKAAAFIKKADPEVIILTSPHGIVFRDAVAVTTISPLSGDLKSFGAPQVKLVYENDTATAGEIIRKAVGKGISTISLDHDLAGRYEVSQELDHGTMVPLYYLNRAGVTCPIVPVSISLLPFDELYQFGTAVREAVEEKGCRAVFLASGDLSHRLTEDAPSGYNPRGKEYDLLLIDLLKKKNVEGILELDPDLIEDAGECGLRSFIMMLGAFDGYDFDVEILSYEGPFGVGYLVAQITPGSYSSEKSLIEKILDKRQSKINQRRAGESVPVALARQALEEYINKGQIIDPPGEKPDILEKKAGVFVSLKKHGQLRGCIGTIEPVQNSVAEEIIQNALSAGTRDPRFNPVDPWELKDLTYSVDVLSPPESISGLEELNPEKYGVIVRSGYKSGLLLPNLEGIDTPQEQVDIAMKKAGIRKEDPVKLERFQVVRYY